MQADEEWQRTAVKLLELRTATVLQEDAREPAEFFASPDALSTAPEAPTARQRLGLGQAMALSEAVSQLEPLELSPPATNFQDFARFNLDPIPDRMLP
jgi:hypothetical protein